MPFNFVSNIEQCRLLIDQYVPLTLIHYSHFGAVLVAAVIGVFVMVNNRALVAKIFSALVVVFSTWVLIDIVLWTSVDSRPYMFFWSMASVLEVLLFLLSFYFLVVFASKKDVGFLPKLAGSLLVLPVIFLSGHTYGLSGFSIPLCVPLEGPFWQMYIFPLELLVFASIIIYSLFKLRRLGVEERKPFMVMSLGVSLFLFMFSGSGYLVDITDGNYLYELIGIVGMVVFLGILSFSIVKYKTFNIKLIASQALVVALVILIGSQFFFIRNTVNQLLNGITLALSLGFGYLLVRSVKKEIEAKELIERQRDQLERANTRLKELDTQKNEFVSFATHQIRSPLASMKGYASLLLEGDAGPLNEQMRKIVETIFISTKTLSAVVEDYLNISRIELGTMKYDLRQIDFKGLVAEVFNEQKPNIEAKGLVFSVTIDQTQTYPIKADTDKFKQVLMNIVDNSVKYTPTGSLTISLEKDAEKHVIRFKVADTGVGITPEVMPKLFRKFSRAKNASEVNIHGTGLGLFIAREIVTAHGGRVWAESEGEGKGSRFVVEVPEVR